MYYNNNSTGATLQNIALNYIVVQKNKLREELTKWMNDSGEKCWEY